MISTSPNERALLGCLLAKLASLDADVLVGHNIGAYELAVLMGRLQTHKVCVCVLVGVYVSRCVRTADTQSVCVCVYMRCFEVRHDADD